MTDDLPVYEYEGARSLVLLHDQELRSCFATWRAAKEHGVELPMTEDPAYKSLAHLLRHLLSAAGGYVTWACEKLNLEDPGVPPVPEVEEIEAKAESYLESVLACWRGSALSTVAEKEYYIPVHISRWNVAYCVDAMLEHAVMHPIRHEFQLRRLLDN